MMGLLSIGFLLLFVDAEQNQAELDRTINIFHDL